MQLKQGGHFPIKEHVREHSLWYEAGIPLEGAKPSRDYWRYAGLVSIKKARKAQPDVPIIGSLRYRSGRCYDRLPWHRRLI